MSDETAVKEEVSAFAETIDEMVEAASIPNLASLFRKAKEQGVIGSVSVYGEGAPTS